MNAQARVASAANLLALRALRVAASIPVPAQRMPALMQMLSDTDAQLALDVGRSYGGGVDLSSALRYGYGRWLARRLAAGGARGLGSYYAYSGYSPWADYPLGDWREDLEQASEDAQRFQELLEQFVEMGIVLVDSAGRIYDAVTGLPFVPGGGGDEEEGPRRIISAEDAARIARLPATTQRAVTQQLVDQGYEMPFGIGALPGWVLPVGAAAGAFAVWKLFFSKKKRKAPTAK